MINKANGPHQALPSIAPLERLCLPPHLDGSMLHSRTKIQNSHMSVKNDLDTVILWLNETTRGKASFDSYRLEAERCLLWATVEQGKPLTALGAGDLLKYREFLLDPQPYGRWICVGKPKREHESWRPFRGALSQKNVERALRIILCLFEWLEENAFIEKDSWNVLYEQPKRNREAKAELNKLATRNDSVTSSNEWFYIRKALLCLASDHDELILARTRTVLYLAYYADMKPNEIHSLRTRSIAAMVSGSTPLWKLEIASRPPPLREIVLLPPVQQSLEYYLSSCGIVAGSLDQQPDCLVITATRKTSHLSETRVRLSGQGSRAFTRQVFLLAAELAQAGGDHFAARRLSRTTLNWLKHAFEAHTAERNMSKNWCWALLGSCWFATSVFRSYLPPRVLPSPEDAWNAFNELQYMWHENG